MNYPIAQVRQCTADDCQESLSLLPRDSRSVSFSTLPRIPDLYIVSRKGNPCMSQRISESMHKPENGVSKLLVWRNDSHRVDRPPLINLSKYGIALIQLPVFLGEQHERVQKRQRPCLPDQTGPQASRRQAVLTFHPSSTVFETSIMCRQTEHLLFDECHCRNISAHFSASRSGRRNGTLSCHRTRCRLPETSPPRFRSDIDLKWTSNLLIHHEQMFDTFALGCEPRAAVEAVHRTVDLRVRGRGSSLG